MSTALAERLQVVDTLDGQVLNVDELRQSVKLLEHKDVAAIADELTVLQSRLREVATVLSDELVARLDRRGEWTLRVGEARSGIQFEISAPSPTAGTEAYDAPVLEEELRALVARGTLDEEAVPKALKRSVTFSVTPPLAADLDEIKRALEAQEIVVAGHPCAVDSVSTSLAPVLGGITKLRKVPGTTAALDRAKLKLETPARKAKVKAIRRAER